jgi:hypothetical protein
MFFESLDGDWEVEPDRVQNALVCSYRMLWDIGLEDGRNKIDNLHQKTNETFEHYIKRTQKMAVLCKGAR